MPESDAHPESNGSPESNATATATTNLAKKGHKSKSEFTEQEKKNISNLPKMSAEKQLKSEEKSKTKEEGSYETWKDELKKESEKLGKVLESEKGDGSPSIVEEKKLLRNRSQK